MKLKKLTLQGFKSFKDKASIFFDHGITGIVGPNGCGKSNIVDALFWVMGEQSAKHLRGATMKDVIFAGSSKYGPASFAEVSLTLDNNNNKYIHIGSNVVAPSEIQLTRKLYRNGETEYRINGIPCRLKDIHEVFMDTGAGSKSYSVVAQGEIDRIVRSKPIDRRAMIEEVAGITKFKVRRKESLRKIEQTQENLKRIKDLKDEVYKSYKILEQQADKAQNAKKLQEKIRKSELLYLGHKELHLLKEWKEKAKDQQIKTLENQDFTTEKQQLENSLEIERTEKIQQQQHLEKITANYHKQSKELVAMEEKLKFILRGSKDKEKLLAQRIKENQDLEKRQSEREEKLILLQQEWDALQQEKEGDNQDSQLDVDLEDLKETLSMKEGIVDELRDEIQEEKDQLRTQEQQMFKNQTMKDDLHRQGEELLRNLEKAEAALQEFKQTNLNQNQDKSNLLENIQPLKDQLALNKENLTKVTQELKIVTPQTQELNKLVYQLESKLNTLEELQKNLRQSHHQGAQQFGAEHGEINLPILSDFIECDQSYINALESLLGKLLSTLILNDNSLPEHALTWGLNHKDQFLDFLLPLNQDNLNLKSTQEIALEFEQVGLSGIHCLAELVHVKSHTPEHIKQYLQNLLQQCFLVEEYSSEFIHRNATGPTQYPWVSKDGAICQIPHLGALEIHLGSGQASTPNALSYQLEIETITNELENHRTNLAISKEKETLLINEKNSLSEKNHILEKQLLEKNAFMQNLIQSMEKDQKKESQYIQDVENFQKRYEDVNKRKNQLICDFQKLEEAMSASKDTLADKSDYLDNLEEEYQTLKDQFDSKREAQIQIETAKRTFKIRLDSKKNQIKELETSMDIEVKKIQYNQKLISGYETEKTQMLEQIDTLSKDTIELAAIIDATNVTVKENKSKLEELLSQMAQREKRLRDVQAMLAKIEKELVKLESQMEKILIDEQQIHLSAYEKYQVDIWESVKEHLQWNAPEDFTGLKQLIELTNVTQSQLPVFTFNRLYGQELAAIDGKYKQYQKELNQLGEINWTALHDFEEYKKRYQFLVDQETQLNQSIKDLELAISQIDEKSKKKFQQAFTEVNSRFSQVFPYLFRGGSATLELVGDFEDPECGMEIIAQPPGKKMQNILLMSGGEKAMTAVALIFSIFLVRPSPFCLLDEVDAPLDDANVGRFNDMLKEMGHSSQFILITHNKKTMELNDVLYGVTMQEPGISKAVSVQLQ